MLSYLFSKVHFNNTKHQKMCNNKSLNNKKRNNKNNFNMKIILFTYRVSQILNLIFITIELSKNNTIFHLYLEIRLVPLSSLSTGQKSRKETCFLHLFYTIQSNTHTQVVVHIHTHPQEHIHTRTHTGNACNKAPTPPPPHIKSSYLLIISPFPSSFNSIWCFLFQL